MLEMKIYFFFMLLLMFKKFSNSFLNLLIIFEFFSLSVLMMVYNYLVFFKVEYWYLILMVWIVIESTTYMIDLIICSQSYSVDHIENFTLLMW
uniref:NADH dehydrogenase subunit 4L n=1 Tax=Orancistrocerus aterrimus TaxID=2485977 RepID=A0A3G3FWU0_9HYME|nr:NADH dehydrogenase subunit 4L [Orancistrocerus aterrimus]AYQ18928.1 NADH dehydrogenase subunit 4L [Orancistrocerus aterrimus]